MTVNKTYLGHTVLGHSYLFYLLFFVLGIIMHFSVKVPFNPPYPEVTGFIFMCIGTFIVLWAQHSSAKSVKERHESAQTSENHQVFLKGPYQFFRIPTQLGLFALMFGFGFLLQSFFVALASILAFLFSKCLFVKKHESILLEQYGDAYKTYKSKIHF